MTKSPLKIPCLLALLLSMTLPLMAQAPVSPSLYLKFNEGVGTTTADSSFPGSGIAATLNNGASWETMAPQLGAAALRTGPSAGDIVTTNQALSLVGDWTIELWFGDNNSTNFAVLFGDSSAGGFACTKIIGFAGTDLTLSGGTMNAVTISNFSSVGWTHLAYVHDSSAGNIKAYLNGTLKTTVPQTPGLVISGSSLNGLKIGSDALGGSVWNGVVDDFRIWSVARTQTEIMNNMNNELVTILPDDVGLLSVDAPLPPLNSCAPLSNAEVVSFSLRNEGTNTIAPGTAFSAVYTINGGSAILENFMFVGTVMTGQTEQFSFLTPADLSTPGERVVDITVSYAADLNTGNDSNNLTIGQGVSVVSSFPYTENFDSLPSGLGTKPPFGWTQDPNNSSAPDGNWNFLDAATPTPNTGPTADHTTGSGHFAYVEDSQANHAAVNLLSPCFDLSGLTAPSLKFYLHSQNDQSPTTTFENFFSVDVLLFNGAVVSDAVGPIGHLGASWQAVSLDLSPYAGFTVQLRFRGRSDGGGGKHDLAIDDIAVGDFTPGIGQAPQAGLATLDLNSASSPLSTPVSSGDNGPYSTSATAGGPLVFTMEGVPGQPVILLFGNLNPVAATFPNIGQMDIGGLPDPMTGIPTGIQVLGNGFTPIDFLDLLFVIGQAGSTNLSFVLPTLPAQVIGAFQSAHATGAGNPIALSNAVELTIL